MNFIKSYPEQIYIVEEYFSPLQLSAYRQTSRKVGQQYITYVFKLYSANYVYFSLRCSWCSQHRPFNPEWQFNFCKLIGSVARRRLRDKQLQGRQAFPIMPTTDNCHKHFFRRLIGTTILELKKFKASGPQFTQVLMKSSQ